jgi:4-hydroxybenzoate polyprenyltransferase
MMSEKFRAVNDSSRARKKMNGFIKSMRPKQWTKNFVLFAGILFSRRLFDGSLLILNIYGFLLFCIFSGSVYILNDIADLEKDQVHPKKRHRPIASGLISRKEAIVFLIISFLGALFLAYRVNPLFALIGLSYFLLVTFYSFYLKHIVLLDVMTISIGFVMRAIAGTVLIGVEISPWLLLCTFLLSMFLAIQKRKSEMMLMVEESEKSRRTLEEYTPDLINDMLHIVTSSTVMAYSLYTFTGGHSIYMMATIPFVIYGIFRYQYIIHTQGMGETPELVLLSDKPLIINICLWVISCVVILYLL